MNTLVNFLQLEKFHDRSSNRRPLTIGECLTLALKLASVLVDVHAHHIVHRDIKPSKGTIARQWHSNAPQRCEVLAN